MDTRWIKCRGVFRHGDGQWEYLEFPSDYANKDILELIYESIRTDSEGIRPPRWAFIDHPPTEWLDEQINELEERIKNTEDYFCLAVNGPSDIIGQMEETELDTVEEVFTSALYSLVKNGKKDFLCELYYGDYRMRVRVNDPVIKGNCRILIQHNEVAHGKGRYHRISCIANVISQLLGSGNGIFVTHEGHNYEVFCDDGTVHIAITTLFSRTYTRVMNFIYGIFQWKRD